MSNIGGGTIPIPYGKALLERFSWLAVAVLCNWLLKQIDELLFELR